VPQKMVFSWIKHSLSLACVALSCVIINSASYASLNLEGIEIYPHHSSTSNKKGQIGDDLIRYQNANNLWDILRAEFSLPHYEKHPAVQNGIDWCMDNQEFLIHTATRATPYLYFIHQQVKKRALPIELVLIPIIESGYNPFNLSSAGAAGVWQLMPDTASGLGVKQDFWYDGRRDIVASTRAALDYLSYLFDFFDGNSLLAIAAYNTGEGSVMSAIRKNIREGKNTDFWSLPLPKETRLYVPRLLALAIIISHPDIYNLSLPSVANAPYLAQVDIGGQIDLKQASQFAGMSLKQFKHLNPGFNRLVTHPQGPYKLMLPIENVERFMTHLARTSLYQHTEWIQYKIKSKDTLESIAKQFSTTSYALREINHLKKLPLKKGTRLVIPRKLATISHLSKEATLLAEKISAPTPTPEKETRVVVAASQYQRINKQPEFPREKSARMQSGDTVYMVRQNDTIEKIAEHFNLPPKVIYTANKLHSSSVIHPGDQILVPTHLATAAETASSTTQEIRKMDPGDTLYMIRKGDSIETIAKKFRTTAAAIRVANLMMDSHVQEGEHIIVPTHTVRGSTQGRSLSVKMVG